MCVFLGYRDEKLPVFNHFVVNKLPQIFTCNNITQSDKLHRIIFVIIFLKIDLLCIHFHLFDMELFLDMGQPFLWHIPHVNKIHMVD